MARRILVVDDEQAIARLVRRNLEQAGYEVDTAADGREALRKLGSFRPDLVVLDILMPFADGYEVMEILKSDPETRNLPVVILTAKSEEADIVRGWQLGADCYITKPFDIRELLSFARRILDADGSGDAQ